MKYIIVLCLLLSPVIAHPFCRAEVGDIKQNVIDKCGYPLSQDEVGYQPINESTYLKIETWVYDNKDGYYLNVWFIANKVFKIESIRKD